HMPLLGNGNSFQLVPGFDPGHTMGTCDQEPHSPIWVPLSRATQLRCLMMARIDWF
ncbi:hypothetical protein DSO57_1015443, partial [Entomophthora muscae]